MKKSTFDFTLFKESKQKVDVIAADVAKAEAEILLAEEALEIAKRDDGTIAPDQLVKRIDEADRLVKIRRIEANRTAAKLQEVEGDLYRMTEEASMPVIDALSSKFEEEKERIRNALAGILGESLRDRYEVSTIIGMSEPIARIGGHINAINHERSQVRQGFVNANWLLAEKVIEAEQLL